MIIAIGSRTSQKQKPRRFDGQIIYQDVSGNTPLINGNDPIDLDALTMENERYNNANGLFGGRLKKAGRNFQKRRDKRVANRQKLLGKIVSGKNKAKLALAKANQIAAKNLGKNDPALAAALSQPASVAPPEQTGWSTGKKIAVIGGIGVAIIATIYLIKKYGKGKLKAK